MLLNRHIISKTQNEVLRNLENDFSGSQTIYLVSEDVPQSLCSIREQFPHLCTLVQPLHNFSDVQARLHVHVNEGLAGIIKAPRILLLQMIHHLLYHPLGSENLIGLLRRDVVEDVFCVGFIKIVRKHSAKSHEFSHRIIKHNRIKQLAGEELLLTSFFINVRTAIP